MSSNKSTLIPVTETLLIQNQEEPTEIILVKEIPKTGKWIVILSFKGMRNSRAQKNQRWETI